MRALAVRRGTGVDDDRFVGLEHGVQNRHGRVEGEETIELERRGLAVEGQRLVAA